MVPSSAVNIFDCLNKKKDLEGGGRRKGEEGGGKREPKYQGLRGGGRR